MPPFVLQQDCDNPSHLVTRLGGAYETGMTQSGLSPRRFL
jgi:hypothetical protein